MKRNLFVLLILASSLSAPVLHADQYVQGYTRSNGTYVQPHYQSSPDGNRYNNYTTQGNVNPYNGNMGYRTAQPIQQPYSNYGYRSGGTIRR